ncbi:MAG: class IV adenylate cyclase [bacterium]|nr:class IV adenylate cyclase [bacterium]
MEDTEIEIQVNIKKIQPLLTFLKKKGQFKGKKRQVDTYFIPAHRDFRAQRPINEWLRLRDTEGKFSINYKNWHRDEEGKSTHCDEYETKVEDLKKLKKIFQVLDFEEIVEVDKERATWVYKDYEIEIDKVKGLGDFVEIEYIGKKAVDPKNAAREMIQFLKDLGCQGVRLNQQGYAFINLFPNEFISEEV